MLFCPVTCTNCQTKTFAINCLFCFFHEVMLKLKYFQTVTPQRDEHPCAANPCGANAVCIERSGAGACKCLPDYFGDPYGGCRPQCVTNSDCPSHYACLNNKCKDPCNSVCALNAECRVINHSPQCNCMIGYVGNPLIGCHKEERVPPSKIAQIENNLIRI